jgi:hypothetical protein
MNTERQDQGEPVQAESTPRFRNVKDAAKSIGTSSNFKHGAAQWYQTYHFSSPPLATSAPQLLCAVFLF